MKKSSDTINRDKIKETVGPIPRGVMKRRHERRHGLRVKLGCCIAFVLMIFAPPMIPESIGSTAETSPAETIQQNQELIRELAPSYIEGGGNPRDLQTLLQQFQELVQQGDVDAAIAKQEDVIAMLRGEVQAEEVVKRNPVESVASTNDGGSDSTNGPAKTIRIAALPAEASIIFHKQIGNSKQIFVTNADAEDHVQLTFGERRHYEHVDISDDRRYVAASALVKGTHRHTMWVFDLQEGTETQMVPHFVTASTGGVVFGPDGYLYFSGYQKRDQGAEIYRIMPDGTGLQKLTNTPREGELDVSVSDDGSLITFVRMTGGRPGTDQRRAEIWLANSDGSNPRRLYKSRAGKAQGAADPEIDPNNTMVAFSVENRDVAPNFPGKKAFNTAHDIWVIDIESGEKRRVTKPGPISIVPNWYEDKILYLELNDKGNYRGAVAINSDGTGYTRLGKNVGSPRRM